MKGSFGAKIQKPLKFKASKISNIGIPQASRKAQAFNEPQKLNYYFVLGRSRIFVDAVNARSTN